MQEYGICRNIESPQIWNMTNKRVREYELFPNMKHAQVQNVCTYGTCTNMEDAQKWNMHKYELNMCKYGICTKMQYAQI